MSRQALLFVAFTGILFGYFMVWLPNEAAGLAFIGLEMGEQVKFLPQVKQRALGPDRTLFYLPPITLSLMLLLLTARWDRRRWQTWAMRILAVALSSLAFPALEVVGAADRSEWLWRLLLIALVAVAAVGVSVVGRRLSVALWGFLLLLPAFAGAILPTWAYLAITPAFYQLLRRPVTYGPGLWLNLAGHLLVVALILGGLPDTKQGEGSCTAPG